MPRIRLRLVLGCIAVCMMRSTTTEAADSAAPPPTTNHAMVDVYHGVEVRDDYRWLEDSGNSQVQQWSAAQNVHVYSFLFHELDLPYHPVIRAAP